MAPSTSRLRWLVGLPDRRPKARLRQRYETTSTATTSTTMTARMPAR